MMKQSKKPKQSKLSKQQKMILKILYKYPRYNSNVSEQVYTEQYGFYPEYGDLNPSHSSSVSRSARRLENRDLIYRQKYNNMFLTRKGINFCKSLFEKKK